VARQFLIKSPHPVTLGLRAAWQHEFGDIDNSITAQFADAPAGGAFTSQATSRDRDAAALGLDFRVPLTASVLGFADYSATLSSSEQIHAIFGGVRLKW